MSAKHPVPVHTGEMLVSRRHVNGMLLAGLAALAMPPAAASAQHSAPPYLITDFDWVDRTRSRPVPTRLYWPATAVAEKSVPLVVFSHGIGGSREGYSYLGKYWSARGVASLHIQHIGSDRALWRGNPFGVVNRLQAAAQEQEAIARAADMRFALDKILSDASGYQAAAINHQRLVAAGHSYGANTTLLTVGAQVVRNGQTIDCLDSRFAAAVVISAPPFYGESDLAAILKNVAVPTIHITATDDVIQIPGYRSGAEDRLAIFEAITNPHKLLAVFRGGSHSMFTDRPFTGGFSLNPKVKIATADLALAFLALTFDGDGGAFKRWRTQWQSILAETQVNDFERLAGMTPSRFIASPNQTNMSTHHA